MNAHQKLKFIVEHWLLINRGFADDDGEIIPGVTIEDAEYLLSSLGNGPQTYEEYQEQLSERYNQLAMFVDIVAGRLQDSTLPDDNTYDMKIIYGDHVITLWPTRHLYYDILFAIREELS